jgi:hypothetical protein
MMALTPVSLNSEAVIGSHCGDIAIGVGATLIEIVRDNPDLVVHALVLTGGGAERELEEKNAFAAICASADIRLTVADLPDGQLPDHRGKVQQRLYLPISSETAHQKARLLAECYPSQSGRGWFDDEALLGLMRVRGVQCRARYAEAFTLERTILAAETNYSVN